MFSIFFQSIAWTIILFKSCFTILKWNSFWCLWTVLSHALRSFFIQYIRIFWNDLNVQKKVRSHCIYFVLINVVCIICTCKTLVTYVIAIGIISANDTVMHRRLHIIYKWGIFMTYGSFIYRKYFLEINKSLCDFQMILHMKVI